MDDIFEKSIICPYCWEKFIITLEPSLEVGDEYVEDCYICCRPIQIKIIKSYSTDIEVSIGKIEGNG